MAEMDDAFEDEQQPDVTTSEPGMSEGAESQENWLEELAAPSAKRRRTAPVVDASRLPADSVRARVAARQAAKIEAFRHVLSTRGESLELPERDDSADSGSIDDDAIGREEKRIGDDESKFMATVKRMRQEERGIVNLPDKLKDVLKAQRAALTSKFSELNRPLSSARSCPDGVTVPESCAAHERADAGNEHLQQGMQPYGDEDAAPDAAPEVHATVCSQQRPSRCLLLSRCGVY